MECYGCAHECAWCRGWLPDRIVLFYDPVALFPSCIKTLFWLFVIRKFVKLVTELSYKGNEVVLSFPTLTGMFAKKSAGVSAQNIATSIAQARPLNPNTSTCLVPSASQIRCREVCYGASLHDQFACAIARSRHYRSFPPSLLPFLTDCARRRDTNVEHRKVPWRLSRHQKYRHRERLRHVDSVVSALDTALRRMGQSMKKVERWKTEMPTEEEMLPKDKYTVFDRKVKRYRKGIHSKWHTLCNFAADAFEGLIKGMGSRLWIYSDDLQRFPSGRGSVSDSILQVSRWPSWQKMAKDCTFHCYHTDCIYGAVEGWDYSVYDLATSKTHKLSSSGPSSDI